MAWIVYIGSGLCVHSAVLSSGKSAFEYCTTYVVSIRRIVSEMKFFEK